MNSGAWPRLFRNPSHALQSFFHFPQQTSAQTSSQDSQQLLSKSSLSTRTNQPSERHTCFDFFIQTIKTAITTSGNIDIASSFLPSTMQTHTFHPLWSRLKVSIFDGIILLACIRSFGDAHSLSRSRNTQGPSGGDRPKLEFGLCPWERRS